MRVGTEAETKTTMDFPFAHNPGELVYAQRLNKFYQEVQAGHPPVFGLAHCCYSVPYDCTLLLNYSKLWWAANKFEYRNQADRGGENFLGWHKLDFYAVPKKDCLRLYDGVPEQ